MTTDEFEKIYRTYYTQVYKYLFVLCKSEDLTVDLLQETFIKAFRYYKPTVKLYIEKWLMRIAKNIFFNYQRSLKNESVLLTDNHGAKENPEANEIHWQILRADIERELDRYKKEYVKIFSLRIDESMTLDQIGISLNIPTITIRRKMQKIKKIIEKKYDRDLFL